MPASKTKRRSIVHYAGPDGRRHFSEWIFGLKDAKGRATIVARLGRIKGGGSFGDVEPVGEGVSEMKIDFGPGYRVYFGLDGEMIVVLLAGGDKDSQASDIALAKRQWRQYNA